MHRYPLRPKALQNRQRRIKITLLSTCILSIIVAATVSLSWVWKSVSSNQNFLITHIRLPNELQHTSSSQLKNIVKHYAHGNLFSFNALPLDNALIQLPWIDRVSIRKIWPHTLTISIKERQAVAHWQANQLLDQNGNLFTPGESFSAENIPSLSGPVGKQLVLWQHCQYFNQTLAPLHLWIKAINLTERKSWRIQLNNGLRVFLGVKNWQKNLTDFVRYYPHIIEKKSNNNSYIDMRYPNGFVIGNKQTPSALPSHKI